MAVFNQIGGISTSSVGSLLGGPLSSLLGNGGANILQYPQDLTNDPSRMHWVQFTVFNTVPNDFATAATDTTSATSSGASSSESGGILGKISGAISSVLPTSVTTAASTIGKGVFGSLTSPTTTQAAGQVQSIINLYMPDTLAVAYNNNYDELSLTQATGGGNRLIQGAQDAASQLKSNSAEPNKALAADPKITELLTSALSGSVDSEFTKLSLSKAGYAVNPLSSSRAHGKNRRV